MFRLFSAATGLLFLAVALPGWAQGPPVKVTIQESDKIENTEAFVPVDPRDYVEYRYVSNFSYGLKVEGKRLCLGDGSIRPTVRIDGKNLTPNQPKAQPLPAGKSGKPRSGVQASWTSGKVTITQTLEVIPSKLSGKAAAGQKRRRDTLLTTYVIENKDAKAHDVGVRVRIDTLLVNNDGALFASPTTHPGKVLNGVELKGKTLPEWLQILERPDLNNPGYVAVFTLKVGGKLEGPSRFICTTHGAGDNGWDVNVQQANGDSDCVIYFEPLKIPPGGKRECGYAYGGGIASSPEGEGRVSVNFAGSFEPNKEFTVTAYVDDPFEGQNLTLELPKGMARLEGKATQAVPLADDRGQSVVMWKGRVLELGTFEVRIRSSNGMSYTRTITVSRES